MGRIAHLQLVFMILALLVSKVGLSQTETNRTKQSRITEAYGYLTGQEYRLNKISEQHSDLSSTVLLTELRFKVSFGVAKVQIVKYLKDLLGDKFSRVEEMYYAELVKTIGSLRMSKEEAMAFLDEVDTRSKGNMPSPVLETLLHFEYLSNPSKEFTAEYVKAFRTKGHPKAKGTDWQIKVPKSWSQKEADRPNIVQMFQSEYGDGNETILMMVNELPTDLSVRESDIDNMFSEEGMRTMVPQNAKYLSSKKLVLDNNKGGVLELEVQMQRLDYMMKMRILQFMFIKKDKLYILQAGTGSTNLEANLSKEMEKYLPLFRQVANSIVVLDQYR